MRPSYTLFVTTLAASILGCGGSQPADVAQSTATNDVSAASAEEAAGFVPQRPQTAYTDPRQAVNDFLIAVKNGNDQAATALLSTNAQREAWTNGLAISAEGFPDARFDVSEVEYLNENKEAHVMSVWENKSNYSEQKSFQCVWFLKSEAHGWSVSGMATKFLPHLDPIVLNFENQAEMQRRQDWAQREIEKFAELQMHQQQANSQQAGLQGQQPGQQQFQQATRPGQTAR